MTSKDRATVPALPGQRNKPGAIMDVDPLWIPPHLISICKNLGIRYIPHQSVTRLIRFDQKHLMTQASLMNQVPGQKIDTLPARAR